MPWKSEKREEESSWRYIAAATAPEFRGILGHRVHRYIRKARNRPSGPALTQGSRICKGLLSHATQRALSPAALFLTSHTRRTFRRSANGRNTRAITCRYWSLIGAPGPSVDMPIIGLPRRQPTPVRLVSTRCYACAYRTGASAPLFHCANAGADLRK